MKIWTEKLNSEIIVVNFYALKNEKKSWKIEEMKNYLSDICNKKMEKKWLHNGPTDFEEP